MRDLLRQLLCNTRCRCYTRRFLMPRGRSSVARQFCGKPSWRDRTVSSRLISNLIFSWDERFAVSAAPVRSGRQRTCRGSVAGIHSALVPLKEVALESTCEGLPFGLTAFEFELTPARGPFKPLATTATWTNIAFL
jgi:hypothetical protein